MNETVTALVRNGGNDTSRLVIVTVILSDEERVVSQGNEHFSHSDLVSSNCSTAHHRASNLAFVAAAEVAVGYFVDPSCYPYCFDFDTDCDGCCWSVDLDC